MIKKVALIFTLVLYFVSLQNFAFADDAYNKRMYLDKMEKTLDYNWLTPLKSKGKSAVISFILDRNGDISNVKMLRSSEDDQYDDSAMTAIYKTASFGPLVEGEDTLYVKAFFSPLFTSVTASERLPGVVPDNTINIANTNTGANFSEYDTNLGNQINANWNPKTLKDKRSAVMTVELSKDGSLNTINLVKSSKNGQFDLGVLESILKSVPLAPLPAGYNADSKIVQLNFNYEFLKEKKMINHNIVVSAKNIIGYDEYTKKIDTIIANTLGDRRYYHQKDLMLEINIDKIGKIRYAKIIKPSKDKGFDLKMLSLIWNITFPPIPDVMGVDNITLNYEILTQRERTLHAFIFDYLLCLGRTGIKSFSIID